ncbi:FitA-like ribbon-helix-helix domain-containing protein [Escherichia coli]
MKKFQVRNFPDDAYFALEQLANENQRSVEGEARYAL